MRGWTVLIGLACLALAACAPGMQPLLDDYNAMFEVTLAGGGGGEAEDWLRDTYEVPSHHTLNLQYPYPCSSCSWKLESDPGFPSDNKVPDSFDIGAYGGSGPHLYLDLKKAGFTAGTYYALTCTVEKDGKTLTDSCKIVIVDRL